jgi:outer membrane autotransporter protein
MFNVKDEIEPGVYGNLKSKVGAQSFFFNGYFDIHNDSPVTPYIGAGLGLARVSGEFSVDVDVFGNLISMSETKTNFAWNVGAGAAFEIADSVALDLGYRYADFGKVDGSTSAFGGTVKVSADTKVKTHEVLLGLRFTM